MSNDDANESNSVTFRNLSSTSTKPLTEFPISKHLPDHQNIEKVAKQAEQSEK